VRRVALLGGVALLAAGCGGSAHGSSVAQVERAFAAHGQPLHAVPLRLPVAGAVRRAMAHHVRAFLVNTQSAATTFSTLSVLVFDSDASAVAAQRSSPWFSERAARVTTTKTSSGGTMIEWSGFMHRKGDVIAAGGADRWPAVRAALAEIR
jgi:hypothetical protein